MTQESLLAVVLGSHRTWTLHFKVCVCVCEGESKCEREIVRDAAAAVMLELWQFFCNVMPGVSSVILLCRCGQLESRIHAAAPCHTLSFPLPAICCFL